MGGGREGREGGREFGGFWGFPGIPLRWLVPRAEHVCVGLCTRQALWVFGELGIGDCGLGIGEGLRQDGIRQGGEGGCKGTRPFKFVDQG